MAKPGDCVHIHSGYQSDGSPAFHRFVVLTESHPVWGLVLVNFSTVRGRRGEDLTVVFRAGEFEFLPSDSYIVYSRALVLTQDEIENKIQLGQARVDDNVVDEGAIKRILAGVRSSGRAPIEVEEICEEYLRSRLE